MDGKILECYHHYNDIHGLAKMIEQYFHNELPFCHDTLQRLLLRADSSIVGLVFSDSMHRLTGPTITLMVASVYLWPDHLMAFTKILSLLFKDLRTIMGFFQWHFYVLSLLAVLRALCIATQPKHLLNKYQPVQQCVILLLIKNQFIRRGLVYFRVVIPLSLNERSLAFSLGF